MPQELKEYPEEIAKTELDKIGWSVIIGGGPEMWIHWFFKVKKKNAELKKHRKEAWDQLNEDQRKELLEGLKEFKATLHS